MRGSRRQLRGRGKTAVWQLRVYAGKAPVTGKPVYVSRTAYGTAGDADTALAALVAEVGTSDHTAPGETLSLIHI